MTILPYPILTNVYTPEFYGADPTGVKDSTAALQAAINAAQAVSGAVELGAGATYLHNAPLTFAAQSVEFFGHGASIIKATAAMAAQLAIVDTAFSHFHDFTCDGANLATIGPAFSTSGGDKTTTNTISNVVSQNHPTGTGLDFSNQGHEDLTWVACLGRSGGKAGITINTPGGQNRLFGCSIFGWWTLTAQQIIADGCVTGPIQSDGNSAFTTTTFRGCYMYDGVDTFANNLGGTVPTDTFTLEDCYLVTSNKGQVFSANLPGSLLFKRCTFIYNGPAQGVTLVSTGAGNPGQVTVEDCRSALGAGTGPTILNNSGSGYIWTVVKGGDMSAWGRPSGALAAPAVPASGTALTNAFPGPVIYTTTGGTVSAIAVGGVATGLTAGPVLVLPGHTITWTYTVVPTVTARQGE